MKQGADVSVYTLFFKQGINIATQYNCFGLQLGLNCTNLLWFSHSPFSNSFNGWICDL